MLKNSKGVSLAILCIVVITLIILAVAVFGIYKLIESRNEEDIQASKEVDLVNINGNTQINGETNLIGTDGTVSEVTQPNLEQWRKKLWDYFTSWHDDYNNYNKYYSVRLEYMNGTNELENNDFLLKKGYDMAINLDTSNQDPFVSKEDFDSCLLKYYGRLPQSYNNETFTYNEEKQVIEIKEGYSSHGSNVLFLTDISFDGTEYTAYFNSYNIPEEFLEDEDFGEYNELLSSERKLNYDQMYNNLVNNINLYSEYKTKVKIMFQEVNDIYQIHWLSSI